MPQIDFRQIFSVNDSKSTRPADPSNTEASDPDSLDRADTNRGRFIRVHWLNIGFVCCACLGALFSATYLYSDGEILRVMKRWSRETPRHRPEIAPPPAPAAPGESEIVRSEVRIVNRDSGGGPFSRSHTRLSLNQGFPTSSNPGANHTLAPTGNSLSPTSLLQDLRIPSSETDLLTRSLTESVDSIRGAASEANIKSAVSSNQASRNPTPNKIQKTGRRAATVNRQKAIAKTTPQARSQTSAAKTSVVNPITNPSIGISPQGPAGNQLGLRALSGPSLGGQGTFRGIGR